MMPAAARTRAPAAARCVRVPLEASIEASSLRVGPSEVNDERSFFASDRRAATTDAASRRMSTDERHPHVRRLKQQCAHVLSSSATTTPTARCDSFSGGFTVGPLVDAVSGTASSFGVEVRGLATKMETLSEPPEALARALQSLLTQHKVIVCRFEAPLTVPQMKWIISLLGDVKGGWARCHDGSFRQYLSYGHPSLPEELCGSGIMEHRSGIVVSQSQLNEKYGGNLTATGGTATRPFVYEGFHTDDSYTEQPAIVTMLHARELPPSGGGDTVFLDMASVYQQIAHGEHDISAAALRGRCAEHAYNNQNAFASRPSAAGANDVLVHPRHPLLRRHPQDSTLIALYLDLDRATGDVDGCQSLAEGQQLLQRLQDKAEADAPRYSHQWHDHDVLIWDNITVQHAASSDFQVGENRTMWRCLLEGEVPCGY